MTVMFFSLPKSQMADYMDMRATWKADNKVMGTDGLRWDLSRH